MHRSIVARAFALIACSLALPALAVQSCDLDGQPVNPNNGNTTQGKTGLMRCRDGEGGPLQREQELKNGVLMGAVRYYKDGQIERDYRVNEKGNRDGLYREYAPATGGGKPVLVREETSRDGKTTGLMRTWYPTGVLRRVTFYESDRDIAAAEFNPQGQLAELRCGPRAVLGPDADDAHWCGHTGGLSKVTLYGFKGAPRARAAYEGGERRKLELLWDDGSVRELQEASAAGGLERSFAANGTQRREVRYVFVERAGNERPRRVVTLEQEFHESGKLVREKRWKPSERGADLVSDQSWYLNGQPKDLTDFTAAGGKTLRRETGFHDNGKKASESLYALPAPGERGRDVPTGVQKTWDAEGKLRSERYYDERGRIARERELEANGGVLRDDEVFEDGSRKAYGR